MQFFANCVYQGYESRPGVKDPSKIYTEVGLLDGLDQVRCSVEPSLIEKVLPSIPPFQKCKCTFEFNVRFNSLKLMDIAPVK